MTIELTWQVIIGGLLAICGGIVSIGAAITVIVNWIAKLRSPEKIQNERLDKIELELKESKKEIEELKTKQQETDDVSKVTLDALFALLSHGISGNAIEEMTEAQRHLKKHLIDK